MKRLISSLFLIATMFSCNTKNNCFEKVRNSVLIEEYIVERDTCNKYESFNRVNYYNDSVSMEGYGDRLLKFGEWKFYNKSKLVTQGVFEDGVPTGKWKFPNMNDVEWEVYKDEKLGFQISKPTNWKSVQNDNFYMFYLGEGPRNCDFSGMVSVFETDRTLESLVVKFKEAENKNGAKNLVSKKIQLLEFEDSYEVINRNRLIKGMGETDIWSILLRKSDKIYIVSIEKKSDVVYDFNVLKEQIMFSFKVMG